MTTVTLAMCLTGCSGDAEEPAGLDPTPEPSVSTTAPGTNEQDVAAIQDLYAAYWDAVVASENGPDPDPALFDGVADGGLVEEQLARVQNMVQEDQHRTGRPTIGEVQVGVDGDEARAEACVDQKPWGVVVQGQTQPPFEMAPGPIGVQLERKGDGWLIVARIPVDEAEVTC